MVNVVSQEVAEETYILRGVERVRLIKLYTLECGHTRVIKEPTTCYAMAKRVGCHAC
jgi:hypothetical protein